MGKEQLEIKKEPVEQYEKMTIKDEPCFTHLNNTTVEESLTIKSEPIDNGELDVLINPDENVTIKEEFCETFVKPETFVDASKLCNVQIENEDPLKIHEYKNSIECSEYDLTTTEKHILAKHILDEHIFEVQDFKLQCPICCKFFATKYVVRKHILSIHQKKNEFRCSICLKVLGAKANFKKNIAQVNEKPFRCSFCPTRFSSKTEFSRHFVRVHKRKKSNQCPNCPARFEYRGELNNHLNLFHGGKVFQYEDSLPNIIINNSHQDISEMILPD